MKRIFSLLLTLVIFGSVLMTSCAQSASNNSYTITKTEFYYNYNDKIRELTIIGSGEMNAYTLKEAPWENIKKPIIHIVLSNDITSISG